MTLVTRLGRAGSALVTMIGVAGSHGYASTVNTFTALVAGAMILKTGISPSVVDVSGG